MNCSQYKQTQIVTLLWLLIFAAFWQMCLLLRKVRWISLPLSSPSTSSFSTVHLSLPPSLPLSFLSWDCISLMLKHSSQGGTHLSTVAKQKLVCVHVCYTQGPARATRTCKCVSYSQSHTHTHTYAACESLLQHCSTSSQLGVNFGSGTNLSWRLKPQSATTAPSLPPCSSRFSAPLSFIEWQLRNSPTVQLRFFFHTACVREREWMNFPPDHSRLSTWHIIEPWAISLF